MRNGLDGATSINMIDTPHEYITPPAWAVEGAAIDLSDSSRCVFMQSVLTQLYDHIHVIAYSQMLIIYKRQGALFSGRGAFEGGEAHF